MKNILIVEKDESASSNRNIYKLEGIFTTFSNKHKGRIYDEKDYLPHIEDLKNRKSGIEIKEKELK